MLSPLSDIVSPIDDLTTASPSGKKAKRARKEKPPIKTEQLFEAKEEGSVKGEQQESDASSMPSPVQPEHQDYPDVSEFTPDYLELLQVIQNRISALLEPDKLAAVVGIIQQTGCFAVSPDSFDFDLCLLDRHWEDARLRLRSGHGRPPTRPA